MMTTDAVVVGAGVVGLAVARELARAGLETIVVDGEDAIGSWTSSRNSEVIHAGIYYSGTPLKAKLCVEGRERLYAYAAARDVPVRRLGKLIFAADEAQLPALDRIAAAATAAGVRDLQRLSGPEATALEPALAVTGALLSPSTGIVDSHAYMTSLLADAEADGATLALRTRVARLSRQPGGWGVHLDGEPEPAVIAGRLINAAGLTAHVLAQATEGLEAGHVPTVRYARGVYFAYVGKTPFSRLIYPTPVPGGLGTHLTLDMAGAARFGPDVEWIDTIDYSVDPGRHGAFVAAARLIWPNLDPGRLTPGYAGIRTKLSAPGEPAADFVIAGPETHGLDGLVNLFGIESPGLTASLAIAAVVAERLGVAST